MDLCFQALKSYGLSSLLLSSVAFSSQSLLKDEEAGARVSPPIGVTMSEPFVEKSSQPPHVISSLASLWDFYDLFIVDIMGVVHNGEQAFQPAVVALNKLFDDPSKKLIFISNTQRLGEASKQTLIKFGLHPEVTVFTSGDAVRQDLAKSFCHQKVYHFGETLNAHLTQDLDVFVTSNLDDADLVMVSHYSDSQSPLNQFDPLLKDIAQSSLPILCVNPDKTAPRGPHDFFYCSGTFAEKIEHWGGHVDYYGKPNVKIYHVIDDVFHHTIPKTRMIMIGDTLETDIEGAKRFGIDSLLVETGNTGKDILKSGMTTLEFLKDQPGPPTFVMEALTL